MKSDEAEQMLAQLQHGRSTDNLLGPTQLEDLNERLLDVLMWCKRHANSQSIRDCLRPARLSPHPLPVDRWSAVEGVALARRAEMKRSVDVTLDGVTGRLLVYFPDAAVADGAAELASKHFFDVHNAPPCGTWVGYFDDDSRNRSRSSYLLAWVPQVFISLATKGITANHGKSIVWLDDAQVTMRHIVGHLKISFLIR